MFVEIRDDAPSSVSGERVALLVDRFGVGSRGGPLLGIRYGRLLNEPPHRVSPAYLFTLQFAVLLGRLEPV